MIRGEKVLICGLTRDSLPKIYEWVNQPELKQLTGTVYPVSEFEHDEWLRNKAQSPTEKLFLIRDRESLEDIGTIGIRNIDWVNSNAELYISIGNMKYIEKGGGYGSDAIITLCDFCFDVMGLHKIYLTVFKSNCRAIRSYEKAGFVVEGELKEHHFSNGHYEDMLFMSKLSGGCKPLMGQEREA